MNRIKKPALINDGKVRNMRVKLAIIKHELQIYFKDRNTLVSILAMPILFALISVISASFSISSNFEDNYNIYYLGQEMEKTEIQLMEGCILTSQGSGITTFEEFKKNDDYRKSDVVVEFGEESITIYYDSTDTLGETLKDYAKSSIMKIQKTMFYEASSKKMESFEVIETNIGKTRDITGKFASMLLPYLYITTLVSNCLIFVSDHFAGEKEQGIFEKLLLAPVEKKYILTGKTVANSFVGIASSLAYMIPLFVFSNVLDYFNVTGVTNLARISINTESIVLLLLATILLSLFFSSLGMICSMLAKSAKDVSNYTMPVYAITIILSFLAIFRTGRMSQLCYLVPVYNVCLLFQDMLGGELLLSSLIFTIGSAFVCVVVSFWIERKVFQTGSMGC